MSTLTVTPEPVVSAVCLLGAGSAEEALRTLAAAVRQRVRRMEILVAATGQPGLVDQVKSFGDPRIVLLADGDDAHTPGALLNLALRRARGKYIAYLSGGDIWHAGHIRGLLKVLEASSRYQAVYGDIYKTYYRPCPGGMQVLGRTVAASRDFDPILLCCDNFVSLSSLMHTRALLDRAQRCNESLRELTAWDWVRRLAFFGEFVRRPEISAETFCSVEPCPDGLSESDRLERTGREVRAVRAARPAKPWPNMPDLAIVSAPSSLSAAAVALLRDIELRTAVPHRVYLALTEGCQDADLPHGVIKIPMPPDAPRAARVDAALALTEADCVAVLSEGSAVGPMWAASALHALLRRSGPGSAIVIGQSGRPGGLLLRRDDLLQARRRHPALSVVRSLQTEGIRLVAPLQTDSPLQFDALASEAAMMERDGDWRGAAGLYERLSEGSNADWARRRQARAMYYAGGRVTHALKLARRLNERLPLAETLLIEGRLLRRRGRTKEAAAAFRRALEMVEGGCLASECPQKR